MSCVVAVTASENETSCPLDRSAPPSRPTRFATRPCPDALRLREAPCLRVDGALGASTASSGDAPRARTLSNTCAVAVMIPGPPLAHRRRHRRARAEVSMVGDMLDRGRFPGAGKSPPKARVRIRSARPACRRHLVVEHDARGQAHLGPERVLTVLVSAPAFRSASTTDTCVVPESSSWFPAHMRGDVQRGVVPRHRPKARVELGREHVRQKAPDAFSRATPPPDRVHPQARV